MVIVIPIMFNLMMISSNLQVTCVTCVSTFNGFPFLSIVVSNAMTI